MRAIELLGIEVIFLLAIILFVLSWVRVHRKQTKVTVYLSGGPLDGQELKLLDPPAVYTHYLGKGKTAVYKSQGSHVYLFDDYVYELEA